MLESTPIEIMAGKKKMHLNFFEMANTGNHMTIGQWK